MTTEVTITEDDRRIVASIRAAIEQRGPEYVYDERQEFENPYGGISRGCVYSADGGKTGSCVIGKALIEGMGIPYDPKWEGVVAVALAGNGLLEKVGLNLSPGVADAARVAQARQDSQFFYRIVSNDFEAELEKRGVNL